MSKFKDHFSGHAGSYAKYRPDYPDSIFKYLSDLVPEKKLAWDCATGNGQAAIGLSPYFEKVVATDASRQQIENAQQKPNITYKIAGAENSGFAENSVDIILVAQALHWFSFDEFFKEVYRVLKQNGIFVVCSYFLFTSTPEVDKIIAEFYYNTLHTYWPPERIHIEKNYSDITFPFDEISMPFFEMTKMWDFNDLIGYLNTWSAVKNYIRETGDDCLKKLAEDLRPYWKNRRQKIRINWQLYVRVFKKNKADKSF